MKGPISGPCKKTFSLNLGRIPGESPAKSDESRVGRGAQKIPCFSGVVQDIDNTEILDAARSVPCVEVIDGPAPAGARLIRAYYPDQRERMVSRLREMPRRDRCIVAIDGSGMVGLYRRAKA